MLIDEKNLNKTAVDFPDIPDFDSLLGDARKEKDLELFGLSEPEAMRHYTKLSNKNYSVDGNFYPLGSCTMKYNPRVSEELVNLNGFANIHPLQPESTAQGALKLLDLTASYLKELTGMDACTLTPSAGAHGELCAIFTIRKYLESMGDAREIVLIPKSAHGTNPASCTLAGYKSEEINTDETGRIDLEGLKLRLQKNPEKIAAIMITNPNTCGVFEKDIVEIAKLIHYIGGLVYMDGANFNAFVGKMRPADIGVDAMHINVHKTFGTPHGGGGPGAGPVVFVKRLEPFMPNPRVVFDGEKYSLKDEENAFGRLRTFNSQFSVIVKTFAYLISCGLDGLRQVSEDAVLNANYLRVKLKDTLHLAYDENCMHEVLFDDSNLKEIGITTLDIAKALIDYGFHPMTVYFPLIVHGAMLIEPTETESKETLDRFVDAIKEIIFKAKNGKTDEIMNTPITTPVQRLDETKAAREPILNCFCK